MTARVYEGVVMRASEKTVRVLIEYSVFGNLKRIKKNKNILAHDEYNCSIGDTVGIKECPRYSKNKSFKVYKVNGDDVSGK